MVGGGGATLTGLVFVAMTLHLKEIAAQPVHRHRARTILTGFTAVFAQCGLVLMGGQSRQAVAAELVLVVAGVEVILLRSIRDAAPAASTGVLLRTLGSFACLPAGHASAVVLFAGGWWGLHAVGAGMMSSSSSWSPGRGFCCLGSGRASHPGSLLSAAWSYMLACRARGLGTAWTTLHLKYEAEIAALLGLPGDIRQGALIPTAN